MADIIVPSTKEDLKAIYGVIKEISDSKTRQESENDYQKEAYQELEDKYNIKSKHFRRMAKDFHKDQYNKNMADVEDYQQLYESVFESDYS